MLGKKVASPQLGDSFFRRPLPPSTLLLIKIASLFAQHFGLEKEIRRSRLDQNICYWQVCAESE